MDVSDYEDFGRMRVKGRMHGWVEGVIDGEVDAMVYGRVHAAVISNNLEVDMQKYDPKAIEKAKQAYATGQMEQILSNSMDEQKEGGTSDEA